MRVLMISEHASPLGAVGGVDSGGQNVFVRNVAVQLGRLGHEVDVVSRRDSRSSTDAAVLAPGVRALACEGGPVERLPKEKLLPYIDELTGSCERLCRKRQYDVVHANFFMSGMVALELKKRLGLPFAITFHALGKVRRLHQGGADGFPDSRFAIEQEIIRRADLILAECPQDRRDLVCHYDADPRRIAMVPCGVDPRDFYPVDRIQSREALSLPHHEFIVLQLGRLVPRKGVDAVIRGFAGLRRTTERSARLIIVGGESEHPDPGLTPEIGRLMDIAADEGISELVQFAGRREQKVLRHYYSAADVFVTMPWYEPFGITPLEAMACGTPVIGSRVGGIKYTVVDGVTGFLVPPQDPAALSGALTRLSRHPELGQTLGRNGLQRVRSRFTWRHVAEKLEAALAQIERRRAEPRGSFMQPSPHVPSSASQMR